MKKRGLIFALTACLLLALLAPMGYALDVNIASGTCGEGLSWSLDGYTLTISGSGEMDDSSPWEENKNHIEHVVLTGGVRYVGQKAFYDFDRLKTVDFGDSLVEIGKQAFYGCKNLEYIHLPATFRTFGAESFRGCENLAYVYCDGGMPRFNDSCLWTGGYISVFYPPNNPWPQEAASQLMANFGGRLMIMMGTFDESAVQANLAAADEDEEEETTRATEAPTEAATVPTTAPTEAPTVPTTAPTTAPTEAPTQPTTAPTTIPTTAPTTVPTTQPVTTAPTEPEATTAAEKIGGDGWIGVVLIAAVLTLLIIGALVFRGTRHKNGRYSE